MWIKLLSLIKRNENLCLRLFVVYSGILGIKKNIKGHNNIVENNGALLRRVNLDVSGENNKIIFGKNSKISNVKIFIRGNNHKLFIGNNCHISKGSFWFEDSYGQIVVGSDTTIEDADFASIESASVKIGNDCMFSFGIDIRTGDSHSIIDLENNKRINPSKDIEIGSHVWIGAKATILKGVRIADNVIVGNGSIVTKSFNKSNCVVTGVPAKIVKENVDWCRERI